MATETPDFEELLRSAIVKAKENAPTATRDLLRIASKASEAVETLTRGAATIELLPLNADSPELTGEQAYQLRFRRINSDAPPNDLGVYTVSTTGYPIHRYYSLNGWESHPGEFNQQYNNVTEIEANFKWLVSDSTSRLVVLVAYLIENHLPSADSDGNNL